MQQNFVFKKSFTKTKTIFAKKYQKDLFIFAMALGKHREISSQFDLSDKKTSNIPVSAIS